MRRPGVDVGAYAVSWRRRRLIERHRRVARKQQRAVGRARQPKRAQPVRDMGGQRNDRSGAAAEHSLQHHLDRHPVTRMRLGIVDDDDEWHVQPAQRRIGRASC